MLTRSISRVLTLVEALDGGIGVSLSRLRQNWIQRYGFSTESTTNRILERAVFMGYLRYNRRNRRYHLSRLGRRQFNRRNSGVQLYNMYRLERSSPITVHIVLSDTGFPAAAVHLTLSNDEGRPDTGDEPRTTASLPQADNPSTSGYHLATGDVRRSRAPARTRGTRRTPRGQTNALPPNNDEPTNTPPARRRRRFDTTVYFHTDTEKRPEFDQ